LVYAASRPSLEKLAAEVQAGHSLNLPVRLGLNTIKSAEISRNGIVCLWTEPSPGGSMGFVHCDPEKAESLNLFGKLRLDDGWQFVQED
jgi:hypothetical protein